jgi:hypothetical protein
MNTSQEEQRRNITHEVQFISSEQLWQALLAGGISVKPHRDGPQYGWFCVHHFAIDDGPYNTPLEALAGGLRSISRRIAELKEDVAIYEEQQPKH